MLAYCGLGSWKIVEEGASDWCGGGRVEDQHPDLRLG